MACCVYISFCCVRLGMWWSYRYVVVSWSCKTVINSWNIQLVVQLVVWRMWSCLGRDIGDSAIWSCDGRKYGRPMTRPTISVRWLLVWFFKTQLHQGRYWLSQCMTLQWQYRISFNFCSVQFISWMVLCRITMSIWFQLIGYSVGYSVSHYNFDVS